MQDGDPALLLDRIVPGSPARVPAGERIYAIGDVHGRLDLFTALIGRIRRDSAERGPARVRIVLLGDIIDRGPDSATLIDRCIAAAGRFGDFIVLRGNHEAMMVHAVRGNLAAFSLWLKQGGDRALASWGVPEAEIDGEPLFDLVQTARRRIAPEILAWIDARPLTLRLGDYLFVHAGIRPGRLLAEQSADDLMWIRDEFLHSDADHSFVVVHGHSIRDDGVEMRANRIGIDTGAYRSHILTALALEGQDRWIIATDHGDIAEPGAARETIEADLLALLGGETAAPPAMPPAVTQKRGWGAAMLGAGALAGCAVLAALLWPHTPPPPPASTIVALGRPIPLPERAAKVARADAMPPARTAAETARRDTRDDAAVAIPDKAPKRAAAGTPPAEAAREGARAVATATATPRRSAREGDAAGERDARAARASAPDDAAPARVETAARTTEPAVETRASAPPATPDEATATADATASPHGRTKADPNRAIDAIRLLRRQ